MIVSSITCISASIFVTFLNLQHDHKPTFHLLLWFCPFWSGLVGSCTQKVAFVAGHHSADRAQMWQQSALWYNASACIYGRPGSEEVPLLQFCMKFMSTLATCAQCNVETLTKWVPYTFHSCRLLRSIHTPCLTGINWSNLRSCTRHIFKEYKQILNNLIIQTTSAYLKTSVTYPTDDFSYSKIFACRIPCLWDRGIKVIRGNLGLMVVCVIGTYNTWHMNCNWLCHISAAFYNKTFCCKYKHR